MQEYIYTLNDEDYRQYLEDKAVSDKMVIFRSLLFTYGSLPVLALALYLVGLRMLWVYLGLVLLFFVWIPFSKKILWKIVSSNIDRKFSEIGQRTYKEMKISVHEGRVTSTMDKQKKTESVSGYRLYRDLLILHLADQSDLIIPKRVFKDEKDLAQLMKEIREVEQ